MDKISIPSIPDPLHWLNQPAEWDLSPQAQLTITAPAKTDWFLDPQGAVEIANAPALLFPFTKPCTLSAHVSVKHVSTYDAGVLMVYESHSSWAKLCLELSPQGHPMIVSVVTKGVSDDGNAFPVHGPMYLRISRLEKAYAFHASEDGAAWDLIRYFRLEESPGTQMGFLAQSPTGSGCIVTFKDLRFEQRLLENIRSGE